MKLGSFKTWPALSTSFQPFRLTDTVLVFFTVEFLKRRQPSPRARQLATKVGLVVVVTLTVFALRNDVERFLKLGDPAPLDVGGQTSDGQGR